MVVWAVAPDAARRREYEEAGATWLIEGPAPGEDWLDAFLDGRLGVEPLEDVASDGPELQARLVYLKQQSVEALPLWPKGPPNATGESEEDRPALYAFLPDKEKNTGAAVIVAPGGALPFAGHPTIGTTFAQLDPRTLVRNAVIVVLEIVTLLATYGPST